MMKRGMMMNRYGIMMKILVMRRIKKIKVQDTDSVVIVGRLE